MIWRYAFGNLLVSIKASSRKTINRSSPVLYQVFRNTDGLRVKIASQLVVPGLVSKQFWYEAAAICLENTTFEFQEARDFLALAMSNADLVRRIRRISITVAITSRDDVQGNYYISQWASVLTSSVVGRFVELRGLEFDLFLDHGPRALLRSIDVLDDVQWKARKLPQILRSFQQHQIRDKLTEVTVTYFPKTDPELDTNPLAQAILTQLLDYHPRRGSKRIRYSKGD